MEEPAMSRNAVLCDQPAGQWNDFELIPTVSMESQHSVRWFNQSWLFIIYIVRELWGPEVGSCWVFSRKVVFLEKMPPYGKIFKNCSERIHEDVDRSTYCSQISWNLADRKSVKSRVAYLTKQKQKISKHSRSSFCADRAQNLSVPAPDGILGVPQISSKSVHFRRSYSQTRERRSNAPQSVSNTPRSFSFFAE